MAGKTCDRGTAEDEARGTAPETACAAGRTPPARAAARRTVAVERLGPGDHACLWFGAQEERWALRAAFATGGLVRGERVMLFTGPGTAEAETLDRLASLGVPVGGGRVEVVREEPGYVPGRGFDPAARMAYWERAAEDASARGFTGLRLAGDMGWASEPDVDRGELAAYEVALTTALAELGTTALCEYDRAGPDREPILAAHPLDVPPAPGTLHERRSGDVLLLAGDADRADRPAFERAVRRPGLAAVDLTGLAFVDAYSVRVLLGTGLRLRCTAGQARLLALCGAADGIVEVRTG
ncbi:MEDS domain-containing protein [Actinacidiphila sp. ITFR-21]|uniref:MEDS domain-containing protein n=1 Tax=Actinacidiphila sp. ITFR-21 TaxID=3075199 RepID=UPI00288945FD|nr:MEDS domain-containing protein [Streptomyces sp. ITFR-21]WNI16520.1 MEDS domain-containing protein [Streptomyces sp. ITFR-21]